MSIVWDNCHTPRGKKGGKFGYLDSVWGGYPKKLAPHVESFPLFSPLPFSSPPLSSPPLSFACFMCTVQPSRITLEGIGLLLWAGAGLHEACQCPSGPSLRLSLWSERPHSGLSSLLTASHSVPQWAITSLFRCTDVKCPPSKAFYSEV